MPVIQGYWTSFMRSYDPNAHRAPGTPAWEGWSGSSMRRLMLITNGTAMETVPKDQAARCQYLSGIALSLQQ